MPKRVDPELPVTIAVPMCQADEILCALEHAKYKIEAYTGYPSYEFKLEQIRAVDDVIAKVRKARRDAKEAARAS